MKILGFFMLFIGFFLFLFSLNLMGNSVVYYFEFFLLKVYGLDLTLSFLFDWMSLLYLSVVVYISGSVFIFSGIYVESDVLKKFGILLFFFVFSMVLLVVSGDLFLMFLGWDGLGVTSFLLVTFYQNFRSLNCGMITFVSNRVGDVFMMLIIGLIFICGGWSFYLFYDMLYLNVIIFLFFVASITKSAQFPFSAWLPAAMAAPTPVSALVHSSTLVTAGVYILCRISNMGYFSVNYFLMYLSLVTLVFSSLMACFEFDVKKVIALSTLSQLGLMMFSVSLGLWKLGYFHMITHAMFKSMLFLCGGSLIFFLLHNQDMRFYGMEFGSSFVIKIGFSVSLLSLSGFPFLAGFYSKDLVMEMYLMGEVSFMILFLFFFSMMLTVVYSLRLIYLSFSVVLNYPVFFGFSENFYMNFSVILLMFWSVMGGSVLFNFLFSYEELIFLSETKMIGIYVIVFGGFLFYLMEKWMGLMYGKISYLFSDFFYLFSLSLNNNLMFFRIFEFMNYNEFVWMENIGPFSIVNVSWKFGLILNKFIDIFVVMIIVLFFFLLLL